MNVFANYPVRFVRRERDVARHLAIVIGNSLRAETERSRIRIAGLQFEAGPVNGSSIKAGWSTGLQATSAQALRLKCFAQQHRRRLPRPSRRILLLPAMN